MRALFLAAETFRHELKSMTDADLHRAEAVTTRWRLDHLPPHGSERCPICGVRAPSLCRPLRQALARLHGIHTEIRYREAHRHTRPTESTH